MFIYSVYYSIYRVMWYVHACMFMVCVMCTACVFVLRDICMHVCAYVVYIWCVHVCSVYMHICGVYMVCACMWCIYAYMWCAHGMYVLYHLCVYAVCMCELYV